MSGEARYIFNVIQSRRDWRILGILVGQQKSEAQKQGITHSPRKVHWRCALIQQRRIENVGLTPIGAVERRGITNPVNCLEFMIDWGKGWICRSDSCGIFKNLPRNARSCSFRRQNWQHPAFFNTVLKKSAKLKLEDVIILANSGIEETLVARGNLELSARNDSNIYSDLEVCCGIPFYCLPSLRSFGCILCT